MKALRYLCLLLTIYGLSCCTGPTAIYHSYHHITADWTRNDTLSYEVFVPDSMKQYEAFILIRYLSSYPYKNIALQVEHNLKDTLSWSVDTLQCNFADKERSPWNTSEWGGLYQIRIPVGKSIVEAPRNFNFKITHIMEKDSIPGINDIGILMER